MKAVPYLRVSTDDKGQNPERQLDLVKSWASREGVELLPAVIDEGTSASTSALERPRFLEAIDEARDKGADAILVETVDRLTRRGIPDFWVTIWRMDKEHRLKVWYSDQPLAEQDTFAGHLVMTIKAAMAQQWLERHIKGVTSGMARGRANGSKFGRKPKQFTKEEVALVLQEMAKPVYLNKKRTKPNPDRLGWKGLAHEINKRRGCFEIFDKELREKKMVSEGTIKRLVRSLRLAEGAPSVQMSPPAEMEVVSSG